MTSTFSTVIIFSLLGILRHLHRLQIQLELEAESQETGIQYPRVEAHIKKVGYSATNETTDLKCISDQDILTAINEAKTEAVNAVRELGIDFKDEELEEMISKPLDEADDQECDDDDDDDDGGGGGSGDNEGTKADGEGVYVDDKDAKEESFVIGEDLMKDISVIQKAGLIEEKACDALQKKFKRSSSSTIPIYTDSYHL